MNKIIGGKIPNYLDKSELILDTDKNKLLSYNVLNMNTNITVIDTNNNIIRYSDSGVIYKLNNDFELEKVIEPIENIKPIMDYSIIINKAFKINGINYPYYYIFYDDKFKFINNLLSLNIDETNKIREFISKLFLIDKNDSNKIVRIVNTPNLFNKYIFINKFKFLLELLFKNYTNITNIDDEILEDVKNNSIETITKYVSDSIMRINADTLRRLNPDKSDEEIRREKIENGVQERLKLNTIKEQKLIEILNKNIKLMVNDCDILKSISELIRTTNMLPSKDKLTLEKLELDKYERFYNKFYYIRKSLKTIFNSSKLNLINLSDLQKFQDIIVKSYNHHIKNEAERNELFIRSLIRFNENYLNKNINDDKKNDYNIYLFDEIVEIFNYINYIELINTQFITGYTKYRLPLDDMINDLAMVVILSYFHKRVFFNKTLNINGFDSFPINQNSTLNDLFSENTTIPINDTIKSFYISELPSYYLYKTVNFGGHQYSDCVENTVLQFIKTFFWFGPVKKYDITKMINPKLKLIFENYIIKDLEDTNECKNELLLLLNNIDTIEFKHNDGIKSEIISTYKNIILCINYLLTNCIILDDNSNIETYMQLNNNILSLELTDGNINLSTTFGSIQINYHPGHTYFTTSSVLEPEILLKLNILNLFVSNNLEIFKNNSNQNNYNILSKLISIDKRTKESLNYIKSLIFLVESNKFDHLFIKENLYEKYTFKTIIHDKENTNNNPPFFINYLLTIFLILLNLNNLKTIPPPVIYKLFKLCLEYLYHSDLFIFFTYNKNMYQNIQVSQYYKINEITDKIIIFINNSIKSLLNSQYYKWLKDDNILDKFFTIILFVDLISIHNFDKNNIDINFLEKLSINTKIEKSESIINKYSINFNLSKNLFNHTEFLKDYVYFVLDRMINISINTLASSINDPIITPHISSYVANTDKKYLKYKEYMNKKYLKFKIKYIKLKLNK
jgi:hypothetical protein